MYKWIVGLGLIFCIAGCSESTPPSVTENGTQPGTSAQEYVELKDVLPGYDGKQSRTEIIEFFSYACDHCARFNPQLEQWKQSHAHVHIRKIPVLFSRPQFETLARLYLALQALGHDNLDDAAFAAIHVQKRDLSLPDIRQAWAKENGILPEDLERKMTSSEISRKVNEADELAVKAEIEGVPTLVVGGKYNVSLDQAGTFENMLNVADSLLVK
jgi:thiol:disulfide interchange protein DsbA